MGDDDDQDETAVEPSEDATRQVDVEDANADAVANAGDASAAGRSARNAAARAAADLMGPVGR